MGNLAIIAENISKQYRLGQVGTGTLSHDLNRFWYKVRGKENPYLKIGESNDRSIKGMSDYVWSLKDINFEIEQGDAVGIIGRNGAGKSTLLKLLSKVTKPTTGRFKVNGRIASLLEVGTGFNPEMTGRENIYLNGAILGMRRQEIARKFDEIVDFSGVERYIDTPVKRYSSGMYVRLAFAVAAHLESEILIVDEVLSVGDVEFQKKCLGKMGDVSKGEGRTVLFVSHNMSAVQRLCTHGFFLKNGKLDFSDTIENVTNKYLESGMVSQAKYEIPKPANFREIAGYAYCLQIEDINGNLVNEIPVGKPWQVKVQFKLNETCKHFIIALGISNSIDVNVRTTWSNPLDLKPGEYEAIFKEDKLLFAEGSYHLSLGLSSHERNIHYIENVATLSIANVPHISLDKSIVRTANVGLILNPMDIHITRCN